MGASGGGLEVVLGASRGRAPGECGRHENGIRIPFSPFFEGRMLKKSNVNMYVRNIEIAFGSEAESTKTRYV